MHLMQKNGSHVLWERQGGWWEICRNYFLFCMLKKNGISIFIIKIFYYMVFRKEIDFVSFFIVSLCLCLGWAPIFYNWFFSASTISKLLGNLFSILTVWILLYVRNLILLMFFLVSYCQIPAKELTK